MIVVEHVVIRGWPEDDDWRTQVRDLLTTGLRDVKRLAAGGSPAVA